MKQIIDYLMKKYNPVSVIVYGSYSDGSQDETSDFDALVISSDGEKMHDVSVVDGIQLDVFVYPLWYIEENFSGAEFVQIHGGKIVYDSGGMGKRLKNSVSEYIENTPQKTAEDIRGDVVWCRKMLLRAQKSDTEGIFRRHWLLTDSLEIFCNIQGLRYEGPKKSLKVMENCFPEAYEKYKSALLDSDFDSLRTWVEYLEKICR